MQGAALHGPLEGNSAFISLQTALVSLQCLMPTQEDNWFPLQGAFQVVCMLLDEQPQGRVAVHPTPLSPAFISL